MIVGAYITSEKIDAVLGRLSVIHRHLRPTQFGADEDRPANSHALDDGPKYRRFLAKNPSDYFLFAEQCRYQIARSFRSGYGTIFVDPIDPGLSDDDARALFAAFRADAAVVFAFACQSSEYLHRNRVFTRIGANQIESWVGRDLGRYLPGLYWLTSIRGARVAQIDQKALPTGAPGFEFQLGQEPAITIANPNPSTDWETWAESIDAFCESQSSIFSKNRILPELQAAGSYNELSAILARSR